MLNNSELLKLHTNQRLLVTEMQSRGIDVKIIYKDIELIKAEFFYYTIFCFNYMWR